MRRNYYVLLTALVGLYGASASTAQASTINVNFIGAGIDTSLVLTYGAATDAKYSKAFEITGISGNFSDTNAGANIVGASVSTLVPIIHSTPEHTNHLAPADFSRFAVAAGLPADNHGFLTYDNLYWPGGSPQTATDYPPSGGLLDIYGLMFNIGTDKVVDIYSNGAGPNGVADFGVAVATSKNTLDYVGGGVAYVPLPGALPLFGAALAGLLAVRRKTAV